MLTELLEPSRVLISPSTDRDEVFRALIARLDDPAARAAACEALAAYPDLPFGSLPGAELVRKETGEVAAILAPAAENDTARRRSRAHGVGPRGSTISFMPEQHREPSTAKVDAARAYVRAWRERVAALEALRLRDLRALSELDAARRFAELLRGRLPAPPKPASGLVEQQRILSRLRRTPE
jgi:hypothetical protein